MATPNGRGTRIYWREQGGERRAYGDFRDFDDVGGGREALIPKHEKRATTDRDVAAALAAERLAELERRRRNKTILGLEGSASLGGYARRHLIEKAKAGRVTKKTIETAEMHLGRAIDFFGEDRLLDTIGVADVEAWRTELATMPGQGGRTFSPSTQRHHLNDLSNLYRRATGEGLVPPGYNPVAAMMDKPQSRAAEAEWLEVHDAALLLESARIVQAEREAWLEKYQRWLDSGSPGKRPEMEGGAYVEAPIYPILATFLLTGGRRSEVFGLAVTDVSFSRNTVTFRPNSFRSLKTRASHRVVPLWPQLREVLRAYLFSRESPSEGLLFTSPKDEGMVNDCRKAFDRVASRAGWEPGEIRTKMFRHTYCAVRLQTLDRGAPVSPFTVAREMGHGGRSLVDRVYGHLGDVRHRAEVVEYRVEQHADALGDRLEALRGGA